MKTIMIASLAVLLAGSIARAETPAAKMNWPTRDVMVTVPYAAGGNTDMFARLLTHDLQQKYGKGFIVENKAGAGGTIGASLAAKGDTQGYSLYVGTIATQVIAPFVFKSLRYDPEKDFAPIGLFAKVPGLLVVSNKLPVKTVPELIAYAKAHPGQLNYASSGVGSAPHLSAELFQAMAGVKFNHIPFKASNEALNSIIAGQVDLDFDNITSALPQAKAGTVRALAVTGLTRSPSAPDLPTVAETLPGYEAVAWHGLFAPAGTDPAVLHALASDLKQLVAKPTVVATFKEIGAEPAPMSREEFAKFIASERVKYRDVVAKAGITPQ